MDGTVYFRKATQLSKRGWEMLPVASATTFKMFDESIDIGKLSKATIKTYSGHCKDVTCCNFSSDLTMLVTGSNDYTVCIWSICKKTVLHLFQGHKQQIRCVAFSHDDKRIASAGHDKDILVWDLSCNKCIYRLGYHAASVECVSFSRGGVLLCSGSWDKTTALWGLNDGKLLAVFQHHSSVVQCCSFSSHVDLFATASWDYTINVYDVIEDCQVIATEKVTLFGVINDKSLDENQDLKNSLKNSGNIRLQSHNEKTIEIGERILTNLRKLSQHEGNIKCVAFSCDGVILSSASWDCTVCVWDIGSGTCLHVLRGHNGFVQTCAFSRSGSIVASAGDDRSIRLWSVKSGNLLKILNAYSDEVHQITFTDHGTLLTSGPEFIAISVY